ncbi:MAG: hypothetical protein OI715_00145 (plasmid) [Candidatus Methanoperedens sp.]|nr:MAG: hypothetical protein OI715_00145 [Candidatus Methanoperedens sp.]
MLILTIIKRIGKAEETGRIKECGSVSMESVMDTVTRVFLGISLLGMTFSIMSGTVSNIQQIVNALFVFIRGALSFIPGINDIYFK